MSTGFIINHLWQSSCFALLAGVLALLLRRNPAKVRYGVWLAASVKFLVPLVLLVNLGSLVPWSAQPAAPTPAPSFPSTLTQIATPFSSAPYSSVPADKSVDWVHVTLGTVWALGFVAIMLARYRAWLRIRAALRAGMPVELPIPIPALIAPGAAEPGVVGLLRPVLILPVGLLERLDTRQLGSILAHEMCHVCRRDNLVAAVHMVIEAIFWFHPLVWWIGAHLMEERELACDEMVLRMGCEPADYLEGILKVCQFYTESPLACISGVTGANVKKRLGAILAGGVARELSFGRKVVLAVAALAMLVAPVLIGVLNAPSLRAQAQARHAFEVASVKPIDRSVILFDRDRHQVQGDRFLDRTDLMQFIARAYLGGTFCIIKTAFHEECPLISAALPSWAKTDRFEIQGKIPAEFARNYTVRQGSNTPEVNLMLQVLLEDRFHLKVHWEMREIPVYTLTLGKNPLKLTQTPPRGEFRKQPDGSLFEVHGMDSVLCSSGNDGVRRCTMKFRGSSLQDAANSISQYLDRPVVDRTGLKGDYDFEIESERDADLPAFDPANLLATTFSASMFSSGLSTVGLRLERTKAPTQILVIDHVERPSEN